MAPPRRILFISNGYGEDAIAAGIIRRLPPGDLAEAYPTLGAGTAYAEVCAVVGPRARLPSEGWRNVRHSVARDVTGGLLPTIWPGLKFFRHASSAYDRVVVVGDMIGVYGCFLGGVRNIVYVDVYKTGFGRTYLPLDRLILRRTARTVFCRAETLAVPLRAAGIDARAAGNVMMDTVPHGTYSAARSRRHPLGMTILPGSRTHAVANFALQAAALKLLPADALPDLFLPVAPSLEVAALAAASGLNPEAPTTDDPDNLGTLRGDRFIINLVAGRALGNALDVSDLVLSQAGTATVQAIGLGRPVVTFQSASDRQSRFRDEQRLFGEARQVVPADAAAIANKLLALLQDARARSRLAAIGRSRIGGPGAVGAILASL